MHEQFENQEGSLGVIKLMHKSWYYLPVRYCLYLNKVELHKWSSCVSKFIHTHNGLVTPGISSLDCCKSLTSSRFFTQRPLGQVQNLLSRGSAISGKDLEEFGVLEKRSFRIAFPNSLTMMPPLTPAVWNRNIHPFNVGVNHRRVSLGDSTSLAQGVHLSPRVSWTLSSFWLGEVSQHTACSW